MISSLLELIGALFLAGLPIFLMLARIRRRRRLRAEGAPAGGSDEDGPRREGWFGRLLDRRPDSDLAPYPEPSDGGGTARRGGESRGKGSPSGKSREEWSGLEPQSSSGYHSLPTAPGADALRKRVDRYPPLQRAIVLREILGPPRGFDPHLPGGNP